MVQLVQVVHRGDPRAAQRPPRVWRSGARGFLCTHLGKLTLAVTQQGNSTPFGANPYASSMSVNPGTSSPTGFTIVESTFNDPGNGLYTQTPADLLSTDTFTAIRADGPLTNISLNDPNPFSVTDLYTITAPSGCTAAAPCSFNLTINLSSVPEPAYLTILGSALM